MTKLIRAGASSDSEGAPSEDRIPTELSLKLIFKRLKIFGSMDDAYFDRIYPESIQKISKVHWTPCSVAIRAVKFFTEDQVEPRILDVGSGAGKFCLIGATLSSARFEGIEQRSRLVTLSQELLHAYQIPRVTFHQGGLESIDWMKFNGIYLFNPFEENRVQSQRIDATIHLDRSLFSEYVSITHRLLSEMPPGTRVVTYHGFGGKMPAKYTQCIKEAYYQGLLEGWVAN